MFFVKFYLTNQLSTPLILLEKLMPRLIIVRLSIAKGVAYFFCFNQLRNYSGVGAS